MAVCQQNRDKIDRVIANIVTLRGALNSFCSDWNQFPWHWIWFRRTAAQLQKTYWKVESQWTGENPKQIAWHQRLFVSFSKCWLLLYSFVCWHWESVFVIWLVYIVHSNLRNRLGLEKAGKLVFLFKLMNKKPVAGQEEHSYCNWNFSQFPFNSLTS